MGARPTAWLASSDVGGPQALLETWTSTPRWRLSSDQLQDKALLIPAVYDRVRHWYRPEVISRAQLWRWECPSHQVSLAGPRS